MRYMTPIERKLEETEREDIHKVVSGIDGLDPDERDCLIRMLGLDVTELNPRKVAPVPTLSSLLRERVCAIFTGLWAATLGIVWNFIFHTAVGLAVSKLAVVAFVHAFVWAAWTALVGPVPRVVLCFVYSSILTVSVYAWLFVQQLPHPPVRAKMYTPFLPFLPPTMGGIMYNDTLLTSGCRCLKGGCRCSKKGTASNPIGTDAPKPTTRWGVFPNCVAMKAPVAKEPVTKTHVANVPVMNVPVMKVPVMNVPVMKAPVANVPVMKAPVAKAPVVKTPVVNVPVAKAPIAKAPEAQEEIRRLIKQNEGLRELLQLSNPGGIYKDYAMSPDSGHAADMPAPRW